MPASGIKDIGLVKEILFAKEEEEENAELSFEDVEFRVTVEGSMNK